MENNQKKNPPKPPEFVTNKYKYNRFWKVGQHDKACYSLGSYTD